ncbi:MAG: helix-turn-helix domain-containing protein [Nitriliruptorales bacterium]|nr:helix-turn-helix domain-containing protein [Nitriliruptorales bacterium]
MSTLALDGPSTPVKPGVSVARALGSTTRAGIYEHLQRAGAALTVRDIAAAFDLHPNVARTHLELLADAGLVVIGRRKHPGGGRPAKVYLARDEGAGHLAPAHATGLRGEGAASASLLVRLLVGMLEDTRGGDLVRLAHHVGAVEGRRQVQALTVRSEGPGLETAASTATRALRSHSPQARVVKSGADWVDVAGVRGIFKMLDGIRSDLGDALERGLLYGAFAAAGADITLSEAGTAPGGGQMWRIHTAGRVSARASVERAASVDARGLAREAGVVQAMRSITVLRPGEILEVLAEGPGSPAAFARWADRAGHVLLGVERATDPDGRPAIRLLIRKGA